MDSGTAATIAPVKTIFRRAYPHNNSIVERAIQAVIFGLFVFLFLYLFEPFGLGTLGEALLMASAGFGAVTTVCMFALNIGLPAIFRKWYDGETWTVGKEIIQTTLNIAGIGTGNMFYHSFFFDWPLTPGRFIWFQCFTALVGIFPVVVYVLIAERRRRIHFESEAAEIQNTLQPPRPENNPPGTITIAGSDKQASVSVNEQSLFYIQSTGNYVDVFFQDKKLRRVTIRSTLRALEETLRGHPNFIRCHRSYIVNLTKVKGIAGNAQGYRLEVEGVDLPIPVSRQHAAAVKQKLTAR